MWTGSVGRVNAHQLRVRIMLELTKEREVRIFHILFIESDIYKSKHRQGEVMLDKP